MPSTISRLVWVGAWIASLLAGVFLLSAFSQPGAPQQAAVAAIACAIALIPYTFARAFEELLKPTRPREHGPMLLPPAAPIDAPPRKPLGVIFWVVLCGAAAVIALVVVAMDFPTSLSSDQIAIERRVNLLKHISAAGHTCRPPIMDREEADRTFLVTCAGGPTFRVVLNDDLGRTIASLARQ